MADLLIFIVMDTLLEAPQGQFQIKRMPFRKHELLRGWDAADEYLLKQLSTENPATSSQITLLNDSFGALAVALSPYKPVVISDSYLSQQATRYNLQANGIAADQVQLLDSLTTPTTKIDYLLIKVPKTMALLEHQLYTLKPLLTADSKIIAAGMVKNLPASTWKLLENLIGPTVTSLAVKKARLIFATPDNNLTVQETPYPRSYLLENSSLRIWNHANVFSQNSLDIGSRFLLQHLPDNPDYHDIIDLGCGNGIIGLMTALRLPNSKLYFVDESYMALASAKLNVASGLKTGQAVEFRMDDCLSSFAYQSADCIICNPPFHQQQTVGDHIAWQMFQNAFQVLRKGGELRIIGNRHLQYHTSLKKLFGNCHMIASNQKFVILNSFKR
ncbi:methyltransferase [Methylomonas sp. AM2-LC]|uniref:methyltransferase n=1 Tax=Methylomonas sp. AM2-LC TaxID=3153301 RepID=UPI003266615A